jgi:AhpC/TSA family
MSYFVETEAPNLDADAFVRGEGRRRMSLGEFRGTWVVVALGAGRSEVLDLAAHVEAFAADGAVVLAAMPDGWHDVERAYSDVPVRFPILCGVEEPRHVTLVVDPDGIVRYAGRRQTARELLATLETVLYVTVDERRAA